MANRQRLNPIVRNYVQELVANNQRVMRYELMSMFADKRRDIEKECGYPDIDSLTIADYLKLYDRDPIAGRVIELYPTECWQICPEVYEEESINDTTEFEAAFAQVGRSLNNIGAYDGEEGNPLWSYLERADILSGVGRYGVILLGVDQGNLDEPLALQELVVADVKTEKINQVNPKTKKVETDTRTTLNLAPVPEAKQVARRKLLYMRVLDESKAQVASWITKTNDPRFGQPEFYNIVISGTASDTLPGGNQTETTTTKKVHWTRIIHIAETMTSTNEVLGVPRCQRVYNRLYDLHKLYGGSAEMYWQGAFNGISFETLPSHAGVKITDAQKTEMRSAMENRREGLQRDLILPGLHANSLAPTIADPSPQIERQIEAICIYEGCPKRVFMGSERGELSSNQDTRAWYGRVRKRLNRHVTPNIVVAVVNRFIQIGILPQPPKYCVHWSDISSVTDLERAQTGLIRMQTLKEYVQGGGDAVTTPTDALVHFMGMDEEQAKQIIENKMAELTGEEDALDIHAREDEMAEEEFEIEEQHRQEDMKREDANMQEDRKLQQAALKAKPLAPR
jgi:hypothetical protein